MRAAVEVHLAFKLAQLTLSAEALCLYLFAFCHLFAFLLFIYLLFAIYLLAYCNNPKSRFEEKYQSHQASHNDYVKNGDKTATKQSILTWPIFQSETDEIQAQLFPTPLPLHWNKTEFLFAWGKNMKN